MKVLIISLAYPNQDRLQMSYSDPLRVVRTRHGGIVSFARASLPDAFGFCSREIEPAVHAIAVSTTRCQIVMRLALVILLFLPALAYGQAKPDDEDKVSNDNPGRPLQMPPASTEVKEAIDDFERFSRRKAWERALKAIYTIPEAQALRFVDGDSGFIIPVARKRRLLLIRAADGWPGSLSIVLRRRGTEASGRSRGPGGAEKPRTRVLRLFLHGRRRQCGRPAGRSVLRDGALRSRGRLLAGRVARTSRH